MIRTPTYIGLCALMLSSAWTSGALAQDGSVSRPAAFEKASSPGGGTSTGLAGTGVVVTAETGKTAVSLTLSQTYDSDGRFDTWTFKASTPLDSDTGEGVFVADDDLAHGTSLEFGWTGVFASEEGRPDPALADERIAVLQPRIAACIQALGAAAQQSARDACERKTYTDFSNLTAEERALFRDAFLDQPLFLAGISGTVGYDEVKFRDVSNIGAAISEDRIPWGVTAKFGVLPDDAPLYIGGGLSYERSYQAARTRTLCAPAVGTAPQECFTSPFEAPEPTDSATLYGVLRFTFPLDLPGDRTLPVGIEVKPAYDFESEVAGVNASFYFTPDKDSSLTGGIRVRIQTDDESDLTQDENISVGFFIGKAFSLF